LRELGLLSFLMTYHTVQNLNIAVTSLNAKNNYGIFISERGVRQIIKQMGIKQNL
jgi:hypothetical protein